MRKIMILLAILVFAGCQMPMSTDVENTEERDDNEFRLENYPIQIYAVSDDEMNSRSMAVAPTSTNFFDYDGITFDATYEGNTAEFSFTDATIALLEGSDYDFNGVYDGGDMINVLIGGLTDISFFYGHTIQITMLWKVGNTTSDEYWEHEIINTEITGDWSFETIMTSDISAPNVEEVDDGSGNYDYTIAFKEVTFTAPDSTTYYTWTNPEL